MIALAVGLLACDGETASTEPATETSTEIEATAEVKKEVPVEARVVQARRIEQNVSLSGVLQPLREVEIVAEIQGKAVQVTRELGDPVGLRDTLVFIDDRVPLSQYRQAQAQVLAAENELEIARRNFESDRELVDNGDISELSYATSRLAVRAAEAGRLGALAGLSAMEKQYLDTRITSPITGFVARKYVELGTMVVPGAPLYRVVDLSVLKAEVGVPQGLIGRVRVGSPAQVVVAALGGKGFAGEVRAIGPQADAASGAFPVEVHVDNTPDRILRAGLTVRVEILFEDREERLAVPEHALVTRNGNRHVYRISQQVARLTPVSVDAVFGDQAVVADGLAQGDTVVVVGMKNLGVETRIWIETLHQ